jgi:hypothetical protein
MPGEAWRSLPPGPQRTFFQLLHDMWRSHGEPSSRAIAAGIRRSGARARPGHVTVHNMLTGSHLPRWEHAAEVIRQLGRTPADYLSYYNQARDAATAAVSGPRGGQEEFEIDMTEVGCRLELKSLLRSRGYGHETLMYRGTGDDGEPQRAELEHVLKFVDAAISRLHDRDRQGVAEALFGIDWGWREMSLVERRAELADILHRSPRTIYRMQGSLVDDVAAEMAAMLGTLSPGELGEVISQRTVVTEAQAREFSEKLQAKLAARREDPDWPGSSFRTVE